jgi:hypothetical protein
MARVVRFGGGTARPRISAPACPREALAKVVDASSYSYAALSRMIGRRPGYLSCFVREGHPVALSADDHRALADFFGLRERDLGVRELWAPLAA